MKKLITFLFFVMLQTGFSQWEPCNNGLNGGKPLFFEFLADTVFVGSSYGRLFISTNKGDNWNVMSGESSKLNFNTMIHSGHRLIGGTSKGIFISDDAGGKWTKTSDSLVTKFYAYGNDIWALNSYGRLMLSIDGGVNWKTKNGKPYEYVLSDYAANENGLMAVTGQTSCTNSEGHLFLCSRNNVDGWKEIKIADTTYNLQVIIVDGNNIYIQADYGCTYTSTDNGLTWTKMSDKNIMINFMFMVARENSLYAVTSDGVIYKSTNQGSNWDLKAYFADTHELNLVANNAENIWAGTNSSIFMASDNSTEWKEKDNGFTNAAIYSIVSNGNKIWTPLGNKVFMSNDFGNTWNVKGEFNSAVNCIEIQGNNVLAGTCDGGIYRLPEGRNYWDLLEKAPYLITQIKSKGTYIWAIMGAEINGHWGDLLMSSDNGKTWNRNVGNTGPYISGIFLDNNDVWVMANPLFLSTDNGSTWQTKGLVAGKYWTGKLDKIDDKLFAVSYEKGLFQSTDKGVNWIPKNNGMPDSNMHNFQVIDKNIFIISGMNSFQSTDIAESWKPMKNETGLQLYPKTKCGGYIFAGSNGHGAYRTKADYLGITIGLEENIPTDNALSLFPNPALDNITIIGGKDNASGRFEIYNVLGTKILEGEFNGSQISINVQSLAEGAYILRVGNNSRVFVKR